jgi:tyrosyl-tRNA synthetase
MPAKSMGNDMSKVSAETQFQEIRRGVEEIIVEKDLLAKLTKSVSSGKPLVIKAGFDPTAPDLHLGHTVILQKLALFQKFGHQVVFLIGDFTGLVGDPSGKSKTRPQLTREQVAENAETYKRQVFKILSPTDTQVRFNSEWLDKLDAYAFVKLAAHANVARMLEREDFKKRFKENVSISVHEFLYPLLQAYDSVMLKADVEFGGRDQIFNLLLGRELMKDYGMEPQVCITLPLLEGLDGVQKMSKSAQNYVGIDEPGEQMFGKLMSLPDSMLRRYYELLSAKPLSEIDEIFGLLKSGDLHPKEAKSRFAMEMVARFHSVEVAGKARDHFERVFSQRQAPEEMESFPIPGNQKVWLPKLLVDLGFAASTSEGKRLVGQGAVKLDSTVVTAENLDLPATGTAVLACGKRKFKRLVFG